MTHVTITITLNVANEQFKNPYTRFNHMTHCLPTCTCPVRTCYLYVTSGYLLLQMLHLRVMIYVIPTDYNSSTLTRNDS